MKKERFLAILLLLSLFIYSCGSDTSFETGNGGGSDAGETDGGNGNVTTPPGTYTYSGNLNNEDAVYRGSGRDCYYDIYDFGGIEGETVKIELSSDDFTPYFLVYYEFSDTDDLSNNTFIARGVGGRATVYLIVEGVYTILVLDASCVKTGDYTLTYTLSEP